MAYAKIMEEPKRRIRSRNNSKDKIFREIAPYPFKNGCLLQIPRFIGVSENEKEKHATKPKRKKKVRKIQQPLFWLEQYLWRDVKGQTLHAVHQQPSELFLM